MKRQLELATTGASDTRRLAATIAGALRVGDVVSLTGELGAGKTCFVQGAAAALGVTERVTSPTFLLRREYEGRVPIVHFDVYRLDTLQEAAELGLDEVGLCVTFIEWGDAMQPLLPADHLEISFTATLDEPAASGDEIRHVILRPRGADWRRRIVSLAVDCGPWRGDGGPTRLDALEL
ncbi:tRNA (adenosine(37)-N6)-threonylcarbamoyltransferase complex ATPase subunit type 1 TsaE [soil metagenome]